MAAINRQVIERKLAALQTFTDDLSHYAGLDAAERRRGHYAIERLLQLLCESAADIGLEFLKAGSERALATSYREVFGLMRESVGLPEEMANQLIAACGMRNLLTHLHDTIDLDRVIAAVDPAIALYREYLAWAIRRLG
jgi:uncharacterized protein YutE (UPF0331/DUF86 family)